MGRKISHRLIIAAAVALSLAGPAAASELPSLEDGYPKLPIRIIVPYGAGGGADQVTRALASAIEEISSARFQVETKPGGGGLAAMPDYLSRPKDGYTFMEHDDGLISAIAAGRTDMKMGKDIEPICIVQATFGQVYIRPGETRFTDWKSLVAYAKENPRLSIANSASATAMESVLTDALQREASIKLNSIGFDKPAERYGALMGGHTDLLFEQPGDVNAYIDAGRMKPVLTLLPEAPKAFADVPSTGELGIKVPNLQRVRMFWVHPQVPEARKAYLRKACEMAFNTESFQKFNRRKFMHLARSYYNSEESKVLVNDMIEGFKAAYKVMGLQR